MKDEANALVQAWLDLKFDIGLVSDLRKFPTFGP